MGGRSTSSFFYSDISSSLREAIQAGSARVLCVARTIDRGTLSMPVALPWPRSAPAVAMKLAGSARRR